MVKVGKKGKYKCTGAESSKVCNIDLYKNLRTSQNNSFSNGQCSGTFLHCRKLGLPRQSLSDQAKEIWDYFLANSIMITVKCLPGTLKGPSIKYVRCKEEE